MAGQFKKHNDALWVFLSHSSKDYDQVRELRNIMEEKGMRPLMFFLKCLDEAPEIFNLIKREIDARERFILCDSENARASEWVQKEVEYIKSKERPYVTIDLSDPASYEKRVMELKRRSQIFISYARKDEHIAKAVSVALRNRGFKVFIDAKDIPVGADYAHLIKDSITRTTVDGYFLAIITPNYCHSKYCMAELSWAQESGSRILPCIVDIENGTEIWEAMKHDSLLQYIIFSKQMYKINTGDGMESSIEELCEEIVREDLKLNK